MNDFANRVFLLLGLMAVVVLVDFKRHGRSASKHREYRFILIAGFIGGLAGLGNDMITSSISPEYFVFGKGLEPGKDLRWRAGIFGVKEGLSAGIIGGAICLFATAQERGFSTQRMRWLLGKLWMPLASAVLVAVALPLIAGKFDPLHLSNELNSFLSTEQIARFLWVWWIHCGLYAGLAVGLAVMIAQARRQRVASAKL
jgi:hypothetical protein